MSVITITIQGTDVTADVEFATATFTASVGQQPGDFDLFIKDPTQKYAFETGNNITLDVDSYRYFDGYLLQISKTFAFPVEDTVTRSPVLIWHLRGPDVNVLFLKRVVANVSAPQDRIPDVAINTTDQTVINSLVSTYLDLSSDSLTTDIHHVGTIDPDRSGTPYNPGDTWQTAMLTISQLPGAVWGIKPTRVFYYQDDDTEDAPFRLSDVPDNVTTFGYSALEWTEDGTQLANDAPSWGAGYGSQNVVFARVEDATSIADHGRWQKPGLYEGSIYKQTTITSVSSSVVYGSPQNLHGGKDDQIFVTCRIKKPGLLPGNKVYVESQVHGVSGIHPLRRVTTTFANPKDALFDLQLSREIDRPYTLFDPYKWPSPSIPPPPPPPPIPSFDCGITDTFTRTVADPGWGTSDAGFKWSDNASLGVIGNYVDGSNGILEVVTSPGPSVTLASLPGTTWDLSFDLSFAGIGGTGPTVNVNLSGDQDNGILTFDLANSRVRWQSGANVSSWLTINTAVPLRVHAHREGAVDTTWSANVWDASSSEPSGWAITVTVTASVNIELDLSLSISGTAGIGLRAIFDNLDITGINRCTTYFRDDFNHSSSLGWPNWAEAGNSAGSGAYSEFGGYGQFDGTAGLFTNPPVGEMFQLLPSPLAGITAVEFDGSWQRVRGSTGDTEQRANFRLSDATDNPVVDVSINLPGAGGFEVLLRDSSGHLLFDDYSTSLSMDPETYYAFRVQVQPSPGIVKAKVWRVIDGEPSTWNVDQSGIDLSAFASGAYIWFSGTSGGHGALGDQMTRIDYLQVLNLEPPSASPSTVLSLVDNSWQLCEIAQRIDSHTYTTTTYTYLPGTLDVTVNGIKLRSGIDFFEDPDHMTFFFSAPLGVTEGSVVYICFTTPR